MKLLAFCPPRRIIVDPQGSAVTDVAGVYSTADPTGRTWPADALNLRFVPVDGFDLDIYDRFFRTLREKLTTGEWDQAAVLTDELETVMPQSRPKKEAPGFVYRGRKWGTAHIGATTRPRFIDRACFANLSAAGIWALPDKDDRATLAGNLSIPLAQLEAQMRALPEKGLLWWNQTNRTLQPVYSRKA